MIERHFHRNTLLRTFDVTLGYCIPDSLNTHEVSYDLPKLEERVLEDLTRHPVAIDSFFFDGDALVRMYLPPDHVPLGSQIGWLPLK